MKTRPYILNWIKKQNGTPTPPNLQEKEIEITENGTITIVPDTGYDGLSQVDVKVSIKEYAPDWSQLGYENTPQSIIDAFNYSKNIKDTWDSTATSIGSKYRGNKDIRYFPLVDLSNVTSMMFTFYQASNLEEIDELNTSSSLSTIASCFTDCVLLKKIPYFNTQNVTNFYGAFGGCTKLADVPVLDTTSAIRLDSTFINCPSLTNISLNNILKMCINTTNAFTGTKTLRYIGLSQDQATTCQSLSNWNDFVSAGWTSGY